MTSANPATPLTRAEFLNSCTSVLQGLDCLFRQSALVNEALGNALQQLGTIIVQLMPEIDSNTEYFVDGPLVRYLTAEVSKGKAIIQEIKRTCSQRSAQLNGPGYIQSHNEQHLTDIQGVLEALNTFYQDRLFRHDTQHLAAEVQGRMTPSKTRSLLPSGANMVQSTTNPPMSRASQGGSMRLPGGIQTPMNTPAQNGNAANRSLGLTSAPAALGDSTVRDSGDSQNPSVPGAFEHMHDVQTAGRQPHSDSWPKPQDVPANVLQRTRPPLVYSGIRDVHNYRNLPQFTGVNLPVASGPTGELGHQREHTQHWCHTNKYVY